MQSKVWKFLQYSYLIIAIIFLVEGVLKLQEDLTQAVILIAFSVLLVVLFFFKRKFRLRVEQTNRANKK